MHRKGWTSAGRCLAMTRGGRRARTTWPSASTRRAGSPRRSPCIASRSRPGSGRTATIIPRPSWAGATSATTSACRAVTTRRRRRGGGPRWRSSGPARVARTGLERAAFIAFSGSPMAALSVTLAGRKPRDAWARLESDLGRGLFDELSPPATPGRSGRRIVRPDRNGSPACSPSTSRSRPPAPARSDPARAARGRARCPRGGIRRGVPHDGRRRARLTIWCASSASSHPTSPWSPGWTSTCPVRRTRGTRSTGPAWCARGRSGLVPTRGKRPRRRLDRGRPVARESRRRAGEPSPAPGAEGDWRGPADASPASAWARSSIASSPPATSPQFGTWWSCR